MIRSRATSSTRCSISPRRDRGARGRTAGGRRHAPRVRARLASGNPHKLVELRRALPGLGARARRRHGVSARDSDRPTPRTPASRLCTGAAPAPADAWVIGEDSGIEASGLGGRPGIASARWADDGVARLLEELDGVAGSARAVRLRDRRARPGGRRDRASRARSRERSRTGRRAWKGFGYDPIFVPGGEQRTVAELGDAWKAVNSHRARAAAAFRLAATAHG